ncbi:MAG: hypothetical protein V4482_06460 [Pseudomonadota bacterium]
MFAMHRLKFLLCACVFILGANASSFCAGVYAGELVFSEAEITSLFRRAEIDAHNESLRSSDRDLSTNLHINGDKLNTSALRITYLNKHQAILSDCHARLVPILAEISLRQFDENVHALDPHVVANLDNLLNIAQSLDMGRNVPLTEANGLVRSFGIVSDVHLNQLCAGFDARHSELFSRVATLAHDLDVQRESNIGIDQLITITDNWTTQGGCFQGRRNRLYVALASMMANIGV